MIYNDVISHFPFPFFFLKHDSPDANKYCPWSLKNGSTPFLQPINDNKTSQNLHLFFLVTQTFLFPVFIPHKQNKTKNTKLSKTMTNSESYNTNNIDDDNDYYAILGIPYNADYKMIRKAYLKLSLKYHPDKNVDDVEHAQQQFIRIGRAYQTLSDPQQRRIYDQTYYTNKKYHKTTNASTSGNSPQQQQKQQYQRQSSFASDFYKSSTYDNHHDPQSSQQQQYQQQHQQHEQDEQYETYRNFFDTTMADLSDDEINEILGAATMFSSVVGSLIGAKLFAGKTTNPALRSIGAAIGSAIATHATTSVIKNSHTQAKQRVLLKNNIDPAQQQQHEHIYSESRQTKQPPQSSSVPSSDSSNHWQEIVENVMSGPIAKEVGKVIQQMTNDFINQSNKNNTTKK
jgi:curved DNA-binding protein CbpA